MAGIVDRYKAWPKWARIAAPSVVGLVVISSLTSCGDDASAKKSTTTTTAKVVSLSDATAVAFDTAEPAGLTKTETATLIKATCDAAGAKDGADALAAKLVDLQVDRDHLKPLVTALGDAAEAYCPADVAKAPDLLNVTYAAAIVLIDQSTTTTEATTTTTPAPTTTAAPVTTKAPSTTKATTATTKPPVATTGPPTSGDCWGATYYATKNGRCIDDYDANGNGDINCSELPTAARPVTLKTSEDPYGLDADHDGVGCEN